MERKYIEAVRPLGGHVLQVDFVSGSRLLLDMERIWTSSASGLLPTRRSGTVR